jgi:8-oxo-dGTP pyrophosphatase MutT (NUDIX family)
MLDCWKTIEKKLVESFRPLFDAYRVERESPTGNSGQFYVLDSHNWINVIVIDTSGCFVCVKQYRHGTDEVTLETPAGMVEPDESPRESAKREVREETGYVSDNWREIGSVSANPAFLTNDCRHFLATDARQECEPSTDPHEEIEVELLDRNEFFEAIRAGDIDHSLTIASAYFYRDYKSSKIGW